MDDLIRRSDAIKAVEEAFDAGDCYCDRYGIKGAIQSIPAVEPCKDAISREYALGVIYPSNIYPSRADIYKALKDAPSVTVEPKQGEWIEREVIDPIGKIMPMEQWQSARCSICGKYHTTPYMYYFDEFNFCPNCGAKMKGVDND